MSRAAIACWIVAALFAGVGGFIFLGSRGMRLNVDRLRSIEPIRLKVDLSATGEFTGPLNHAVNAPHGISLHIETASGFASYEEVRKSFGGLAGRLIIRDKDGRTVFDKEFTTDSFGLRYSRGPRDTVSQAGFFNAPLDIGNYQLTLAVGRGAPGLAGIPQELAAHYEVCGEEAMIANFLFIASLVSQVPTLIFMGLGLWLQRRYRRRLAAA